MANVIRLDDLEATKRMAGQLASHVRVPLTIAINGTLGAGKTQWIRYFAAHLGVAESEVTSPTYILQQEYRGRVRIIHFDFYRLESEAQVWDLGIDELFEQHAVVLIEWADKFPNCLPNERITLQLEQTSTGGRLATVTASGARCQEILGACGF